MGAVIFSLLGFSLLVEQVQKSKVPKSFYKWMLLSALAPIIVAIGFSVIYVGNFDWIQE